MHLFLRAFMALIVASSAGCSWIASTLPDPQPLPGQPVDPCGHYAAPVTDVILATTWVALTAAVIASTMRRSTPDAWVPAPLGIGAPLAVAALHVTSAVDGFETDHACLTRPRPTSR